MQVNERELMKIRDMLEEIKNLSKYVNYKDKSRYKKNRKALKKMIDVIEKNDIGDVIDELFE